MVVCFAVLLFVPVLVRGPPRDYDDMEVGFVLRSYNLLGLPWWDAALTVGGTCAGSGNTGCPSDNPPRTPPRLQTLLVSLTVYATGFDAVDKNIDGWLSVVLALESFVGCDGRCAPVGSCAAVTWGLTTPSRLQGCLFRPVCGVVLEEGASVLDRRQRAPRAASGPKGFCRSSCFSGQRVR